jgi:hypothetical protein
MNLSSTNREFGAYPAVRAPKLVARPPKKEGGIKSVMEWLKSDFYIQYSDGDTAQTILNYYYYHHTCSSKWTEKRFFSKSKTTQS